MKAVVTLVLLILSLPGRVRSQDPPAFNGAFYGGFSYRKDLAGDVTGRAMGGFEGSFGRGKIQPTLGFFFGGPEPNSLDLGVKSAVSSGPAGHVFLGGGGALYSTQELRAFGRIGYEITQRSEFGLRMELRVYVVPIEPGLFVAVVLPATRR